MMCISIYNIPWLDTITFYEVCLMSHNQFTAWFRVEDDMGLHEPYFIS